MKNLFMKHKPCAILLLLKDSQQTWYPSKLARAAGTSYLHTVNLLSALRKLSIVSLEKKGKQNQYKLTEKGAHIALTLDDFVKKCDAAENEAKQQAKTEAQAPLQAAQPVAEDPKKEEKAAEKK